MNQMKVTLLLQLSVIMQSEKDSCIIQQIGLSNCWATETCIQNFQGTLNLILYISEVSNIW